MAAVTCLQLDMEGAIQPMQLDMQGTIQPITFRPLLVFSIMYNIFGLREWYSIPILSGCPEKVKPFGKVRITA